MANPWMTFPGLGKTMGHGTKVLGSRNSLDTMDLRVLGPRIRLLQLQRKKLHEATAVKNLAAMCHSVGSVPRMDLKSSQP